MHGIHLESGADRLEHIAVLIPAWQPETRLLDLVAALRAHRFAAVLVIDDGSAAVTQPLFDTLRNAGAPVLRHAVNLGKGRALKTGFNTLLNDYSLLKGVVTADADGQHTPADIVRVAEALAGSGGRPVLGTRAFSGAVPLRSHIGNTLTRVLFAALTGTRLGDTQTGLRGLPVSVLPALLRLEGERYEYEMTVLAHLCRTGPRPLEVPIETVYIENNRGSHFNPVWDSMRIYFVLARFYLSSLLAAGIDLLLFTLCFFATHNLLLSVAVGRCSSLVNFALNRRFVFHNRRGVAGALLSYYLLAVAIAGLSYLLIRTASSATGALHWNVLAAKIVVDAVLSLISFSLQRTFVFRRRGDAA